MKRRGNSTNGFTIIELLFSTLVFSVVLLLCLTALLQIGKLYYKGVTTAQTQDSTRDILNEISQAIQFTGIGVTSPTYVAGPDVGVTGNSATANDTGYFCIGATRYTYAIDRQQSDSPDSDVVHHKQIRHVLWQDEPGVCYGATAAVIAALPTIDLNNAYPGGTDGKELIGANMRITRLSIAPLSIDNSTWQIKLSIAYGDDDLLTVYPEDATRKVCKGAQIGTQFCAISEISTIVKRRVL